MSVFLEVTLSKVESNFEAAGLDRGVSLDAAAGRGTTHVALTGADVSTGAFLTERPKVVRVPVPASKVKITGTHATLSDNVRLIVSVDRLAASVSGVVTSSLAGQGSAFLDTLVVENKEHLAHGAVPVQFGNWDNPSAVVGVRDAKIVTETGQRFTVHFTSDAAAAKTDEVVRAETQKVYDEAWALRQKQVVYKEAPTLTKSVMRVPTGLGGSGYDLCISAVAKPPAQTEAALEDMLKAAIMSELGGNQEHFGAFLEKEGIDAAQWASVVMSAFSTSAAWLIPYKGDTATIMLPKGVQEAHSTESWLAEPTRLGAADDCDGSAAWITSAIHQVDRLFERDPKADYPTLRAVWKALAFHKVGIAVLSAHAGNAEDAKGATGQIAGHAQVLALPKIHLVDALGGDETTKAARRELYFRGSELRLPAADKRALDAGELDAAMRALPGVAAEGTGAANSQLWETDAALREEKVATEKRVAKAFAALSPSQGVGLRDLNTEAGGEHRFYRSFVEVLFDWADLKSPVLQARGEATAHLVLGQGEEAGASPKEVALGTYTATPLWKADKTRASLLIAAAQRVQKDTLPRGDPIALSAAQEENLRKSMVTLAELDAKLQLAQLRAGPNTDFSIASTHKNAEGSDEIRMVVPFASLIGNPTAIVNLTDLAAAYEGQVDVSLLRDIATSNEPGRFLQETRWSKLQDSDAALTQRGVFAMITLVV